MSTARYPQEHRPRSHRADAANAVAHHLRADDEVLADPESYFDQVIEIDLSDSHALTSTDPTPQTAQERSKTLEPRPLRERLAYRDQRRPYR